MTVTDDERRTARHRAHANPGKAAYLATEQRAGWNSPLAVYILYCEPCARYTETYLAGHGRIRCDHCRSTTDRIMTAERLGERAIPVGVMAVFILFAVLFLGWMVLRMLHGV